MKILFLLLLLLPTAQTLADKAPSCSQYLFEHTLTDSDHAVSELISRYLYSQPQYEFYPIYSLNTTPLTEGKNLKELLEIYNNIYELLSENYRKLSETNEIINSSFYLDSADSLYAKQVKLMEKRSLFLKHMFELIGAIVKKYSHQFIPLEIHKNYFDEKHQLVIGNPDRILSFVILPGNIETGDHIFTSFKQSDLHKKIMVILVPTLNNPQYLDKEKILYIDLKTMLDPNYFKNLIRNLRIPT